MRREDDDYRQFGGMARPSGQQTTAMPAGRASHSQIGYGATMEPPPPMATAAAAPNILGTRDVNLALGTTDSIDLAQGNTIGRFELIRELGRGGMGQVFLGRDTKLGRKVAVKFLLQRDPVLVERFLVEARATARCAHENIVTIFEVGEHQGLPYMVLELLEGKTLGDVIDTKPSPLRIVELMIQVVRALERAHEHGIIHRDLKPANIFVTDRGQVKVLDFGVARITNKNQVDIARATRAMQAVNIADSAFTRAGALVGTVPYMSPEQWGADEVDHRSDLWAVGIIFWRALVAQHPAGTMHPDKLQVRTCDPDLKFPSIGASAPTLPPQLVAAVDRCLAKRKRDRYQGAAELIADLQRVVTPQAVVVAEEECPYRGLAAFAEADAKYFFGRSNEIRSAVAQLDTSPVLAVIGPSGVGKSSFIQAGLIPAIRQSGAPIPWEVRHVRPGRVPLARLAQVVESLTAGAPQLQQRLLESPGMFGVLIRHASWQRGQRVLIVIDQLEELFTLCEDDQVRRAFLSAVLSAADDPSSTVRVVLSMRADFIDRLVGYRELVGDLSRALFFLSAPDRQNLRETLVRPAEMAGYSFEQQDVIEHMMQVATSRGALPLLSFAATQLWYARDRGRRVLTAAAYNDMGGVAGAFTRHADHVASAIPPQSQLLLRRIMTRLVTPDGTRAVVEHRELISLAADAREAQGVLDHLIRGRLIQLHTDSEHISTVEIVHEMLITEWHTLKRWLDEGHALRGFMHELRQAARQWAARNKPHDLVWRGATAQEALGHANRQLLDLSALEAEFIAAIRDEAARNRRRKVMLAASVLGVLGLVIAGGAFALVKIKLAENQAQHDKLDAVEARKQAESDRQQADTERATAVAAKADLQKQYDVIAEKERARLAAEQHALEANKSEEMTKEQLAETNKILEAKVAEAQAAQAKAQQATAEANASKHQLENVLAKQAAELAALKAGKKGIIDGSLTGKKGL